MIDERLLKFCSSESQIKAVRAVVEHGTQREAAEALGWNKRTLERHLKNVRSKAREEGDHHLPLTGQSHIVRDDEGRMVRWDKTNLANQKAMPLYKAMEAGLSVEPRKPVKPKRNSFNDETCAILPIADPHFGMLAYGRETGGIDYDLDIASDQLLAASEYLIKSSNDCEQGFMVNLGDFMHFDGMKAQTPQSGNILDADSRYGKVIETATSVYMQIVDMMLGKYKNVTLVNVRGNHDESSGLWLNLLCQYAFAKNKRIKILDNHSKFIHFEWKKNLVATHHGDGVNHKTLHEAITRDLRKEHGRAEFTLSLNGHLHGETVKNIGGVRLETLSVLPPNDAWHSGKLYGGTREMSLIHLRESGGIESRISYDPVKS